MIYISKILIYRCARSADRCSPIAWNRRQLPKFANRFAAHVTQGVAW